VPGFKAAICAIHAGGLLEEVGFDPPVAARAVRPGRCWLRARCRCAALLWCYAANQHPIRTRILGDRRQRTKELGPRSESIDIAALTPANPTPVAPATQQ
jgi:hypothetical protein